MGDKKNPEGKEALTKKDVELEGSEVTPPVDGLRRSRRLRNPPPPRPEPQPRSEVGGSSATKRPGSPKQDIGAKKKVTDGDDVSRAGTEWRWLLVQKQSPEPILRKNGQPDDGSTVEVEAVAAKPWEFEESSRRGRSAVGAGRSESQPSQNNPTEVEAHPCLFIDTILDVIFKHIIKQPETGQGRDVQKDVRNIRLVTKFWNTSITRLCRQTGATASATFDIYNNVSYRHREGLELESTCGRPTHPNLTQFLDTMRPSEMIPVQNYKFVNGSVLGPNGEPELFREFLVRCGPEAVSLDLTIRSIESQTIMLNLMDISDLDLGKLTRLKLTIFENHQVSFQANRLPANVKLIELLLTAAKSLREFELSYPPLQLISHRDQEVTLIHQIVPVIVNRLPASVKNLKLEVEMNESGFDGLAGLPPQLKGFELQLPSPMGSSETIYKFLQSQATTLQQFHLFWGCINGVIVDFPRLHELVQLELGCSNFSITSPFEFAELFPKLHCLKIGGKDLGEPFLTLLSSAPKPLGSLKVLHLPCWMYSIQPGLFKGIAKSFPCLAELRLGLRSVPNEVMGEVFTYFGNLELLNITNFSPTSAESIFSGIGEAECSRIEEAQDFEMENLNELQRQPSLLNLTSATGNKLRKLVVGVGSYSDLRITDFSAHFVFLEMENLRELHLRKRDVKFSRKYRDLLEAKLDKLVLSEH